MRGRHAGGELRALMRRVGPVLTVARLQDAGVSRFTVLALERRGELVRIGKSALVERELLDSSSPWEQFRLRSLGFATNLASGAYLTGWSAAVLHGIPTLGDPPPLPTALRPGNAHRGTDQSHYGVVRTGVPPAAHRARIAGVPTVSSAFAAVEVARRGTAMDALVAVDHVLHGRVHPESLQQIVSQMNGYPGIHRAAWAVAHGDRRAESPLETLGRLAFIEEGLSVPLSNVWVHHGHTAYRADHLDPQAGVVLEGDGAEKYNNRPDAHKIITSRDARDRWFRTNGYGIEHYNYAVARYDRRLIIQRYWAAVRSRPSGAAPGNWSFDRPHWL
jgi:hypothetical protein